MRKPLVRATFALSTFLTIGATATAQQTSTDNVVSLAAPELQRRGNPLVLNDIPIENMPVILRRSNRTAPYQPRLDCPQISTYTNASFTGGTYTAQGGFAEMEIAATRYVLPGNIFPIQIGLMEMIFAQQNAIMTTTTHWSVLVYNGEPNSPQPDGFPVVFSSDGTILPHIVMAAGTRGVNVQAMVDTNDPEQIVITNPTNAATHSFTIAFRIDRHNSQTANPCFTAPPSDRNAFPVTDNTVIGCGSGYSQLNFPNENWLFAVNCGANGCPPNGGWTRFSGLQADQIIFGICFTGCRPRGDWVMRVTWDPVTCPPPEGACCFGTAGCFLANQLNCQNAGGNWRGPGTSCGTLSGGQFPGCIIPPIQSQVGK